MAMRKILEKIETVFNAVDRSKLLKTEELCGFEFARDGYCEGNVPSENTVWQKYNGEKLSDIDAHYWLRGKITVPAAEKGVTVRVRITTGHENFDSSCRPQLMIFVDGLDTRIIDTRHHYFTLPEGEHEVLINYYTIPEINDFYPCHITQQNNFIPRLEWIYDSVDELCYDVTVLRQALQYSPDGSRDYQEILGVLDRVCMTLDLRRIGSPEHLASVDEALKITREYYDGWAKNPSKETLSVIGHSHLDVAWLWRICQGFEKAQRTLSNAVLLMDKYPEHRFMFTQPALLEKVKKRDPRLFEKLQAYAKEGRFIVDGAMWVEPDMNLPSGESLVRQIVWGKRFIRENFGIDSKCLWLPDVFGYSAALPQILKKSGVDTFYTTKLSWNDTNRFPHSFFKWQGIDGTEILAHLTGGLGVFMTPKFIHDIHEKHQDKSFVASPLTTFGYGDGGGGPTEDQIKYYERMKNGLPGLPAIRMTSPSEYFDKAEKEFEASVEALRDEPRWVGELYLEFHRGTFTSIAMIKKLNRRAEFLCHNLELSAVTAMKMLGTEYPEGVLDEMWHTLLINQFHDIIPGSSIKDVYKDAREEFESFFAKGNKALDSTVETLMSCVNTSAEALVYNPNPYKLSGVVEVDGKNAYVEDISPLGWSPARLTHTQSVTSGNGVIENDILRVSLDEKGNIYSIIDKRQNREIIESGKFANALTFYEDRPLSYEAWETSCYYTQKSWGLDSVDGVEYFTDGTVGGVIIKSRFMDSSFIQVITLSHNSARIDFKTYADWQEDHVMLRAHFPTVIRSDHATFETQYGHLSRPTHRNTSWDEAKFEVCAHKWADLSEYGCGVAILNDCKYGYSALGGDLSITLLKSATQPYKDGDKGEHTFTYSLLVHNGDFKGAGVIEEATLLNNPLTVVKTEGKGTLPENYSFAESSNPAAVIDCIKRAEDSDAVILRIYEAHNSKASTTVRLGFEVERAFVCDNLENELYEIPVRDNSINLSLKNFELVTVKLI